MHGLDLIISTDWARGGKMKDLEMKYPLDIQYFAEDPKDEEDKDDEKEDELTWEELMSIPQFKQEHDRRVNQGIESFKKNQAKKTKKVEKTVDDGEDKTTTTETVNPFKDKYLSAAVQLAMTSSGIDPKKVGRAVKLIDAEDLLDEEGEISEESLTQAIEDLLKEWPELKVTTTDDEDKGKQVKFKIGSDKEKGKGTSEDLIAKAFGNDVK